MSAEKIKDPYLAKQINFYKVRSETGAGVSITVEEFLKGIKYNKIWEALIKTVRAADDWDKKGKEKVKYNAAKDVLPGVLIAGRHLEKANAASLQEPTGLMGLDLDHLDDRVQEIKMQLANDPYVYSCFLSAGGRGLCVLVKVEFHKWKEAFESLEQYFLINYGLGRKSKSFDASVSNTNRLRYISHDPSLVYRPGSMVFRLYVKKAEAKRWTPTEDYVDTSRDIEHILTQVEDRKIQFHDTGGDWVRMGLSIANKYDAAGESYFQRVSQFRHDYDPEKVSKRYAYFCKIKNGLVNINTFYYICKQAGLDIMSPTTNKIVSVANAHKRQSASVQDAVKEITGMTPTLDREEVENIVKQAYAAGGKIETTESTWDELKYYLRKRYPMKRNGITRLFEDINGEGVTDEQLHTIYFNAKKDVDEGISWQDFDRMVRSDLIQTYDPFLEFLEKYNTPGTKGHIDRLVDSLVLGVVGAKKAYVRHFVTKWLLGIISSMKGEHTPLVLVLTGRMNIGKTRWFRGLLPEELAAYFGETEMEKGQDDEILMTKKLILFNDEFGGMTRHDVKKFKNLTSKQTFSIREPYGRTHKDLRRIAVLCGSSNEDNLLNDTANRRIIPVLVDNIDWSVYDSIDKLKLFIEVYDLYKAGERHYLTDDDMQLLKDNTERFEDINLERELINHYYSIPENNKAAGVEFMQASDIKVWLDKRTNQRLILARVSQELKRAGFIEQIKKVNGKSTRGYHVLPTEEVIRYEMPISSIN